jgi:hypothetical protein
MTFVYAVSFAVFFTKAFVCVLQKSYEHRETGVTHFCPQRRKVAASIVFQSRMFSSLRHLTVGDLFTVLKYCYRCPLHPFPAPSIRRYTSFLLAKHTPQFVSVT